MAEKLVAALIALVLLAAGAWKAYVAGESSGRSEVQALWDADKLVRTQEAMRLKDEAFAKERALRAGADRQRKESTNEINRIHAELDAVLAGVRQHEQRPRADTQPQNSDTTLGPHPSRCAGNQLYREDEEFLIREAALAERVQVELKKCIARYQEIELTVNR